MGTDLANLPVLTASLPQWVERSASAMSTSYPPVIPQSRALTSPQRAEVQAMVSHCAALLLPATKRELGAAVMKLLVNYPQDGASEAVLTARAETWIEALDGLPAWAVDAARRKWMRGEVEGVNPDFAPKPPRLRQIAVDLMGPVHERRNRLTLLLKAEPEAEVPADERARVAAKFAEFKAELVRAAANEKTAPE